MKKLVALTALLILAGCTQVTPVSDETEQTSSSAAIDHMDHGSSSTAASAMMEHDSSMTMDEMVSMLEGKTGDDFDRAFIEGMVPHHQGAVDMARLALKYAKHEEIKQMARDIIQAQLKEIELMHQWQVEWGYAG